MYRSEINIKHSNRSHLYWGIDKATGEVVGIDDVRSRGLNCNCKCAACNGDFIARKGEKNKHHFAHQSNYECVYANEIAIYLFVKMVFASYQTIEAPEVPVKIGSRTEIAKNNWDARVGEVYYQCDPEQYPPLLVAELDNTPTRIILLFGKYYTEDDIVLLKQEACEKGWDCLSISFPRITEQKSINPDLMRLGVQGNIQGKTWIHNAREARWQHRLQENAVTPPQTMPASWGTAYESIVQQQFELDPFTNTLFLFCGRRRDRIKALYWEGDGFVLLYKRLESGSFQWPRSETEAKALTPQQYRWLMEELSIDQPKAHKAVNTLEMV